MPEITKIDAARRQLLAAIHLHWFLVEPLAVYQLAANVSELCDTLLQKQGGLRIRDRIAQVQGWQSADLNKIINSARNFAKHADRDPLGQLEDVTFEECSALLIAACVDYQILAKRSPPMVPLYILWFAATNPEKTGSFHSQEANAFFPGLAEMDRADQITAARTATMKLGGSEWINSGKAELSDNWRWAELRNAGQKLRYP